MNAFPFNGELSADPHGRSEKFKSLGLLPGPIVDIWLGSNDAVKLSRAPSELQASVIM